MRGELAFVGVVIVDEVRHELVGIARLITNRSPIARTQIALGAIGGSVDRNQVLRVIGECFALFLSELVSTVAHRGTECEHVIDLDPVGSAGAALEVELGTRVGVMDRTGDDLAFVVILVFDIIEITIEDVVAGVAAEVFVSGIARCLRGPVAEVPNPVVVDIFVALSDIETIDDLGRGFGVDLTELTGPAVLDAHVLVECQSVGRIRLRRGRRDQRPHRQQCRDGNRRRGPRSGYSHCRPLQGRCRLHPSSCGGDAAQASPSDQSIDPAPPRCPQTPERDSVDTAQSKSSASPRSRTAMIFLKPLPSERSDLSKPL